MKTRLRKKCITFLTKSEALKERHLKGYAALLGACSKRYRCMTTMQSDTTLEKDLLIVDESLALSQESLERDFTHKEQFLIVDPTHGIDKDFLLLRVQAGRHVAALSCHPYLDSQLLQHAIKTALGVVPKGSWERLQYWGNMERACQGPLSTLLQSLKQEVSSFALHPSQKDSLANFLSQFSALWQVQSSENFDLKLLSDGIHVSLLLSLRTKTPVDLSRWVSTYQGLFQDSFKKFVFELTDPNAFKVMFTIRLDRVEGSSSFISQSAERLLIVSNSSLKKD